MKTQLAALLGTFVLLGGLTACGRKATPASNQEASMQVVVVPVDGMSCVACVAKVKKTLASIEGVGDVEVSLVDRNARVRFDPSRSSPERLVAAINGLGYHAGAPVEARR
jgi:copper chaperone CopZ